MGKFIYTRDGTKCRVIHRDDTRVLAAVQIIHQLPTYAGDDFDEYEDDGPIWELSPGQCFDEPPTMQVSEELVKLEQRAHDIRGEITDLGYKLKAAQKEHDEKMAALAERHDALAKLGEFVNGNITHYVVNEYGRLRVLTVKQTMSDDERGYRKSHGRLLSLMPEGGKDGKVKWLLNQYRDGSGGDYIVAPCTSHEEALTHLQAWVDGKVSREYYSRTVLDFAKEHGLALPDGYSAALIVKEQKALLKKERASKEEQRDARSKAEAEWKKLTG